MYLNMHGKTKHLDMRTHQQINKSKREGGADFALVSGHSLSFIKKEL